MPEKKIYTDLFLQVLLPYTHINTFLAKKFTHAEKFFKYFFAAGKFSGLKIRLCG